MQIPCEALLEWRSISLTMGIPADLLDYEKAVEQLGEPDSDGDWFLADEGAGCHSHAQFERQALDFGASPQGEGAEARPRDHWMIKVGTFRYSSDHEDLGVIPVTHDRFFEALRAAITNEDRLFAYATVESYFDAARFAWRIPFLANPPEMGELGPELGAIGVAGLTLQFSDSKLGLMRAQLETSPTGQEHRVVATFFEHVRLSHVDGLYSDIVEKASEICSLFIGGRSA